MTCARPSPPAPADACRRGEESGFTIIELVIALALFVTVLAPVSQLLVSTIKVSGNSRSRVAAAYLAAQTVEQVRSSATTTAFWGAVPLGQSSSTSTVYNITRTLAWVDRGQTSTQCGTLASASAPARLLQVTASVTWPGMGGTTAVTSTTDLAPPPGPAAGSNGAVGVAVVDGAGQANQGATVTLRGADPSSAAYRASILTGTGGCALFAPVPPGTYTASAQAPGEISSDGTPTATSESFSVVAGSAIDVPVLRLAQPGR